MLENTIQLSADDEYLVDTFAPLPPLSIIGITGKARAGKDTIGQYLVKEYGFSQYSFALPIKLGLQSMFGLSDEQLNGKEKETNIPWLGAPPRSLMQTLGTEWGRDLWGDIWVKYANYVVNGYRKELYANGENSKVQIVITDVRFDNEAKWIKSQGGKILCVKKENTPQIVAHKSEDGIDQNLIDVIIVNNSTKENLYSCVDNVLKNW